MLVSRPEPMFLMPALLHLSGCIRCRPLAIIVGSVGRIPRWTPAVCLAIMIQSVIDLIIESMILLIFGS
jgi:hypothetical protein